MPVYMVRKPNRESGDPDSMGNSGAAPAAVISGKTDSILGHYYPQKPLQRGFSAFWNVMGRPLSNGVSQKTCQINHRFNSTLRGAKFRKYRLLILDSSSLVFYFKKE